MHRETLLTSEIVEKIGRYCDIDHRKIDKSSRIGEDLLILGDDAEELLLDLEKSYNIDLSEFSFSDYFPSEATFDLNHYEFRNKKNEGGLFHRICSFYFNEMARFLYVKYDYKTITVGEIIELIVMDEKR